MKSIELSIVIPYTYGGELREQALGNLIKCLDAQTFKDFEVIVVEEIGKVYQGTIKNRIEEILGFNLDKELWIKIQQEISKNKTIKTPIDGKFPYKDKADKYILLRDNRLFNKSWCINVGIRNALANNVLIVDADMLFGKEYFKKVIKFREKNSKFFSGYNCLVCLPGRDNPVIRIIEQDINAMGGIWFVNKYFFFEELGGMNENYYGYGGEDNDVYQRAKFLLGEDARLPYTLVHQYHHWHERGSSFELNPNRLNLLNVTRRKTKEIIRKLIETNLGQKKSPTEIKV